MTFTTIQPKQETGLPGFVEQMINPGYRLEREMDVVQDARPIRLSRYVRSDGKNTHFGGEHISIAHNTEENRLDGIMNASVDFTSELLPDRDQAKAIADRFLADVAPDLVDELEFRWTNPMKFIPENPPHDAPFVLFDANGRPMMIIGQRVKFFHAQSNTWAWVIVGHGEKIMSFEREIGWDGVKKRRTTEQWLHDVWVDRIRQLYSCQKNCGGLS